MDRIISSVQQQQQRTSPKTTKTKKMNKKKPIKVVYISNPMKVNTTASHFRALVQELTGQDAQSPPDPSRFHDYAGGDDSVGGNLMDSDETIDHALVVPPPPVLLEEGFSSFENFEAFDDDVFITSHHQMVENVSALIPATAFYESPFLGHHW